MAQPVPFRRYIPEDTKADAACKVEAAPTEHADAVLSGYQLLQQLHDTGTLDLLRGMFGAGDAVVNHVVNIVSAPEMVTLLRNALAVGTLVANIDPDLLHHAIDGRPEDKDAKAPSLWSLSKKIQTEEARLGLGVTLDLLTALGSAVKKQRATPKE